MADRVCHNHKQIMDAFQSGPRESAVQAVNDCFLSELRGLPSDAMFKKQEDMFSEIIQGISKLQGSACTAKREIWPDPNNHTPYLDITCEVPKDHKDLTS
jgi:hypothetical protein